MDPQIIGPLCGAVVALCGAFLTWLRSRDRARYMAACLAATPEQLALLNKLPAPPPLSAGGPLLLLLVGCLLSVGVPFLAGQAHPLATLERLGVLQPAANKPVDCTACRPPARCVRGTCEGAAAPLQPTPPNPVSASAGEAALPGWAQR